jgi:hypothetical protein
MIISAIRQPKTIHSTNVVRSKDSPVVAASVGIMGNVSAGEPVVDICVPTVVIRGSVMPVSVSGGPVVDSGIVGEPAVDSGMVGEPVVDSGIVGEPAVDSGIVGEPVVDSGIVGEPVVGEPVVDSGIVGGSPVGTKFGIVTTGVQVMEIEGQVKPVQLHS